VTTWLTVKEAADRLSGKISRRSIYRMVAAGAVRASKLGRRILIDEQALSLFILKGSANAITNPPRPPSPGRRPGVRAA